MSTQPQLHSSIVAMVSLASGIASRHPDMGLCQLDKLKAAGIPEHQINAVIEIARHIREEASQKVDFAFDEKAMLNQPEPAAEESCCSGEGETQQSSDDCCSADEKVEVVVNLKPAASCCTTTASGQSCC